ncbi:probable serine/threonine-protein kinase DDB_G0278509 [Papaver somniferum]|uniref:probable serine/threonine-protein kinase DDB_G0278509 n=1 Tax=Papaver somniferum TaxID=3469 RepID=UPI000E6FC666|nr:probable serine/threonine-protein kinase DDB_G0278509 [Papaver somniferum]XP_026387878.1 probable serine/threonine-protein kinase DDB_G0278509 [Papaver somniferum]XP_026387879.1 probable serine/threonine-protein kinase DDB_G0278509 [Papaver somniferum]XP_026387880.1 probable serine/threonine-protein kinase DDB_G0278509 [Papaver somniferum]XP_026387881.1 probable serine/threonine-protein kinase DDB_G0278509 [Papaver somniferum]XP_026387882.1 probable serine/threonine-protein kinase DDB_G0278
MMIVAPESFQETMVPDSLGTKPLKGNSYPSSSWLCIGGLTTTKPDFDPRHKPLKSITSWLIPKLISRSKNKVCPKMKTLETALSDHGVHPYLENICPRNPFRNSSDDKDASKTGVYKMITSRVKGISWSWDSQQVSRSLSYSTNSDVTSSMRSRSTSSSRSSPHRKFYMETDYLNYDISLSNLTFGEQIVQGSCATVYHGLWCGTDVAIKVFLKFDYSDLLMQHSFRQEVLLMKRLRHPNVVLFMGAVTSPPHLCIVTEFLPRGSLFLLLRCHTAATSQFAYSHGFGHSKCRSIPCNNFY